jgi:predicted O-methyltransferase YrrM
MAGITTASQARALLSDIGVGASTAPHRGEQIYDFVRKHAFENCLELGLAHGVGSVYIASALEANGRGHLTSVDNESALERDPPASEVVERAGLSHRVSLVIEPTSYTWFLQRMVRQQLKDSSTIDPLFDFVFIDGAHTWEVDGFAFLLVDKLLKPGGWILFDDLDWTVDDQHDPEVREVWELLVLTHQRYDELRSDWHWGWAHKATTPDPQTRVVTGVAPLVVQLREVARLARSRLPRRSTVA